MRSVSQRRWQWTMFLLATAAWILPAVARSGERRPDPAEASPPPSRFPALSQEKTWSRIPQDNPPLPVWSRILSRPLPRTTAAMLHLDYVHRAENPLDPVLRGKLRWVAADANRCNYGKRCAQADLLRAGLTDEDLDALAGDGSALPPDERAALAFARKLTRAAHTVTDEEVDALLNQYGPEQLVAMVHTLAHANFQDRIFLALGIQVERDGPLPPVEVPFDPDMKSAVKSPKRSPWTSVLGSITGADDQIFTPEWNDRDFADVQEQVANQKTRASRIPLPCWETVAERLPPAIRKKGPSDIVWSNVSIGYQPRLTQTWFTCMRTFQQESDLDRVFSLSMFWVITRSNQCFY